MSSTELVRQIDELGATSLSATAYRHVSAGVDPLTGTGARLFGGRWNPAESFATLYMALEIETVVAELYRLAERQALDVSALLPRELYRFDLELGRIVDLRRSEARASIGLTDQRLRSNDLRFCQEIGAAAHLLELEGLLVPSATGTNAVLAIFADNLQPGSRLDPRVVEIWSEPPPRPGSPS